MTTTMVPIESSQRSTRSGRLLFAWAFALLLLIPITDAHPPSPQQAYGHTFQLFLHGALIDTQTEAERGYERFLTSNPEWAAKFQLLEARALIWRGLSADALHVLAARPSVFKNNETIIESL